MLLALILCLPAHMIICIMTALIIKNVWISFIFLIFLSIISSLIIYLIANIFFKEYIYKKISKNEYFLVLMAEGKNHPWRIAFITRIIFISAGLKDYILAVIDNPFPSFIISAISLHIFFTLESILIAKEISSLDNFLLNERNWYQISIYEKISFILVFLFIIITIILVIYIGLKIQKKLQFLRENQNI